MTTETIEIGDFCKIMTGAPISRAKKIADGETGQETKVLIPRSIINGRILDDEIAYEIISGVKDDLYTHEDDVIVKASTPYGCVYIDKDHEGILVTSFGMILRKRPDSPIDMRYLALYLNQPRILESLQELAAGVTIKMIKKNALAQFEVPLIEDQKQNKLAKLFINTNARKEQCMKLISLSDELLEAEFARTVFND